MLVISVKRTYNADILGLMGGVLLKEERVVLWLSIQS